MGKYAFKLDADDHVTGHWSGKGPGIPADKIECTQQDWEAANEIHLPKSNETLFKYKYINGALELQTDTRITGTWAVQGQAPEDTDIDVNVGDPDTVVTLTLSTQANTDQYILEFDAGTMRPTFVDGVATLKVSATSATAAKGARIYHSCNLLLLTNTLRIRVMEDEDLI